MPAASFLAGGELRICQAIPMQAVTGEYSYNPVFPDSDPDVRLLPDYATVSLAPWACNRWWCPRSRFGDKFVTGYCAVKALELASFQSEISAWERRFLLPQV
ncbi:hypothetical protein [Rhodoferax sp.]|uniref:hypothetical protein n=1 Tax=Rhodoferax sp. TaxID=50421 RepID=UPI0019D82BB3|nr:hypothetical protein [Rhodoferax sp.]MBE0473109.1 hypothetical protein [Rhodoferax sp.]